MPSTPYSIHLMTLYQSPLYTCDDPLPNPSQIDDFLNGKFPLSVAIRVGESVVVVNLHRAKVEEIEMEPPPHKKRCVRARRPSHHDDADYIDSASSSAKHGHQYLNSNHSSAAELMRTGNLSPSAAAAASSLGLVQHRASRRKSHRTSLGHHHHHHHHHRHHHHRGLGSHPSSGPSSYPLGQPADHSAYQPDRSMLTYTSRDTPMEMSVAISAPPPTMEGPSHAPIPSATPIISKDAPVMATIPSPTPSHDELDEVKGSAKDECESSVGAEASPAEEEEAMEVLADNAAKLSNITPISTSGETSDSVVSCESGGTRTIPVPSPSLGTGSPLTSAAAAGQEGCGSVSHTNPEPAPVGTGSTPAQPTPTPALLRTSRAERRDPREHLRREGGSSRGVNRREVKLPESGVSMKRKAVMEAISEILKKMYANTEKGRLPGSFKGRFSSEFTCDSDMREILHSKTTMTSYGSGLDDPTKATPGEGSSGRLADGHDTALSKTKLKEQQQLKDKVASLKWRMQHSRAIKMAKRKGETSPCGWMEALNCSMLGDEPKPIKRSGYCGLKNGFLLAD